MSAAEAVDTDRRWCDDCGHRLEAAEADTVVVGAFGKFRSCGPCSSWRDGDR